MNAIALLAVIGAVVSTAAPVAAAQPAEPVTTEDDAVAPPPPAAPAQAADTQAPTLQGEGEAASEDDRPEAQIGLPPSMPQYGSDVDEAPTGVAVDTARGYKLRFHGYMRAPMRVGWGPRNDGSRGSELHAPPRVPDLSFTNWQYIDNISGPWAELFFTYGNPRASMSVSLASYNQTVGGYRELQSQLGVNQAFVTVKFPEAFGSLGGLSATVGSFTNRYGTAGKYDAGKYETYLFGRTRAAGETLTADLYLTQDLRLVLEHGIGAKLDIIPFEAPNPRPEYLPYGGPVQQGSTFIHHGHAALVKGIWQLGTHYLTSWSPDDRKAPDVPSEAGRMTVTGAELRLTGGVWGDGYIGYSHVTAKNVLVLADALEVLHSIGGWQFKNNYFGRFDPRTGNKPPDTSGTLDTLLFQYSVSLGAIARHPARFWGNGPDLVATVFGMYNRARSSQFSHDKSKFGVEVVYTPLSYIGFGARYDMVQPNLADADESFSVLSPRLVFRTAFLTHERIIVQYSRYFLGSEAYAAHPYNELPAADANVFMISASMWW